MKFFSAFILMLSGLSQGADVYVGGVVPPVNTVVCGANPGLNLSQDGDNVPLATCVVDDNSAVFQESFRFTLQDYENRGIHFTSLTFNGLQGTLGRGITPPAGRNVLPELQGDVFTWTPEEQHSATVGYVVEFRASWKANLLISGAPSLEVTTISGSMD